MKTYTIDHYGKTNVVLSIGAYRSMSHTKNPLAIEVLAPEEGVDPDPDDEDGPYMEPYGTLTVNLDPYTGEKHQSDNRAFIKTCSENDPWAKQLVDALVKDGIAKFAGKIVRGDFGQTYPLYEFNIEKLRAVAI